MIDVYLQTKPDSVKELTITSLRILDTFTTLNYGKKINEMVSNLSTLEKDTLLNQIKKKCYKN